MKIFKNRKNRVFLAVLFLITKKKIRSSKCQTEKNVHQKIFRMAVKMSALQLRPSAQMDLVDTHQAKEVTMVESMWCESIPLKPKSRQAKY